MSHGTFNGVLSGSTFDHVAAAAQRAHREREQAMALQERSERWLCSKLRGQSFDTLESLTDAALSVTKAHYARPLTEQETTLIVRATNSLWMGFVSPAYFVGRLTIVRGESITFSAAA